MAEAPALTEAEHATIKGLRMLAYQQAADNGSATAEGDADERCEVWLAGKPHELVMFCRLMASAYRACEAGRFNDARTQVLRDLLTDRVPGVKRFVEDVPEILDLVQTTMRDDTKLAHTLYILSRLLP